MNKCLATWNLADISCEAVFGAMLQALRVGRVCRSAYYWLTASVPLMDSGLSIIVIICLVASATAGCATTRGPRQVHQTRGVTPAESNWSRTSELAPGTEITLIIKGSQPRTRYLVLADGSGITVLDLTSSTLPASASRVVRKLASDHPEHFSAMLQGGTVAEGDVRLGRDGMFVAGRKVADLGQVVQVIARNDIAEIRGPVVVRGSVLGALLGGVLGLAAGTPLTPGLVVTLTGLGGVLGFYWSSHTTEGTVYQAP